MMRVYLRAALTHYCTAYKNKKRSLAIAFFTLITDKPRWLEERENSVCRRRVLSFPNPPFKKAKFFQMQMLFFFLTLIHVELGYKPLWLQGISARRPGSDLKYRLMDLERQKSFQVWSWDRHLKKKSLSRSDLKVRMISWDQKIKEEGICVGAWKFSESQ